MILTKETIPDFPLHELCSKEEMRPAMMSVLLENSYAVATDGHVLGIVKSPPRHKRVTVYSKVWQKFRSLVSGRTFNAQKLAETFTLEVPDESAKNYPNWKEAIPKEDHKVLSVVLNVNKLHQLVKALKIYKGECKLEFYRKKGENGNFPVAVSVIPIRADELDRVGWMMCMRNSNGRSDTLHSMINILTEDV